MPTTNPERCPKCGHVRYHNDLFDGECAVCCDWIIARLADRDRRLAEARDIVWSARDAWGPLVDAISKISPRPDNLAGLVSGVAAALADAPETQDIRDIKCANCDGTGAVPYSEGVVCTVCNGEGVRAADIRDIKTVGGRKVLAVVEGWKGPQSDEAIMFWTDPEGEKGAPVTVIVLPRGGAEGGSNAND